MPIETRNLDPIFNDMISFVHLQLYPFANNPEIMHAWFHAVSSPALAFAHIRARIAKALLVSAEAEHHRASRAADLFSLEWSFGTAATALDLMHHSAPEKAQPSATAQLVDTKDPVSGWQSSAAALQYDIADSMVSVLNRMGEDTICDVLGKQP